MEVYTLDSGEYPKLKQHPITKRIVLFTSLNTGTQLNSLTPTEELDFAALSIGHTGYNWFESEYEPFTGMVILGGSSE